MTGALCNRSAPPHGLAPPIARASRDLRQSRPSIVTYTMWQKRSNCHLCKWLILSSTRPSQRAAPRCCFRRFSEGRTFDLNLPGSRARISRAISGSTTTKLAKVSQRFLGFPPRRRHREQSPRFHLPRRASGITGAHRRYERRRPEPPHGPATSGSGVQVRLPGERDPRQHGREGQGRWERWLVGQAGSTR